MKRLIIKENIPAKINRRELQESIQQISPRVKVDSLPELTWTRGELDGKTTPASITVMDVEDNITKEAIQAKINAHAPAKSDDAERIESVNADKNKIADLEARIEALESAKQP